MKYAKTIIDEKKNAPVCVIKSMPVLDKLAN